jgi:hypothetical protein
VSKSISERQNAINRELNDAYDDLVSAEDEQKKLDSELQQLLVERNRYTLLSEISDRLDQLQKLGAANMFWGEGFDQEQARQQTQRARNLVVNFDNRVNELQQKYDKGEQAVERLAARINVLNDESVLLEEAEEEVKHEFVIEREMTKMPFRQMVMPWSGEDEDEKRYRRILLISLFLAFMLGSLIPLWEIPIPDRIEPVEVPERLAKLIVQKQKPPPPPPPQQVEKTLEQTPKEKRPKKKAPEPTTEKSKVARKNAESAGLMAFKKDFSELINTSQVDEKLGARASINSLGKTAKQATRSIVTAQAGGSSGGISTASLSRDVGGAGKGMKGVGFERVESAIGSDFFGEERPLSDGPGPSRTDEEIQIVFDRYKAALYRIYNRELRSNPTLQGKMVLRLTIEPDGAVSMCKLDSSDMDSPALESRIVARVLKFNFGPKEDVPPVTILYPIDFLPAT